MMERDWSSMNSTRTWVTPPREPLEASVFVGPSRCDRVFEHTGTAENAGDLDELDGLLLNIHDCDLNSTLAKLSVSDV